MPNYGCVSLKLPATWSRRRYEDKKFVNSTVGHENGVADAYLTKEPDKRHQFAWCSPRDEEDLDLKREQGFEFITDKDWTIRSTGWTWKEGRCASLGQYLMARPAELYFEEEAVRNRATDLNAKADEKLANEAAASGIVAHDSTGQRLKPTQRARA